MGSLSGFVEVCLVVGFIYVSRSNYRLGTRGRDVNGRDRHWLVRHYSYCDNIDSYVSLLAWEEVRSN